MSAFKFGLVHAPLTPFADERIDYDALRQGARFPSAATVRKGLALPTHAGESVEPHRR